MLGFVRLRRLVLHDFQLLLHLADPIGVGLPFVLDLLGQLVEAELLDLHLRPELLLLMLCVLLLGKECY